MTIGEKISILRKARGYSQEQLGLSLSNSDSGVSRQSVSEWENNRSEPKLENIKALAKLLDVSFDALLDEELDLNDPETLSKVISKTTSYRGNRTGYSIRYFIYEYESFCKKFLRSIIIGVISILLIVVGAIMISLSSNTNDFLFIAGIYILIFSGAALISVMILIVINLGEWLRSKDGRQIALLDYRELTIYPRKNDYSNRAIFLPILKITKIQKLVDDVKHCDVEVVIEENEQNRTYVLRNVNNPDRLITVFNNAKSFVIERKKENKELNSN